MKRPSSNAMLHHLKKIMSLTLLLGAATVASAQTNTILYQEDWGAAYASVNATTAGTLPSVGWNFAGGQYTGTYNQNGNVDVTAGILLSNRPAYFSSQTLGDAGIIYTQNSFGTGTNGDSSFASIDPVTNAGLTLNVETQPNQNGAQAYETNYFAVMVGGVWYIAAAPMNNSLSAGGVTWARNSLLYSPVKTNWNILTINTPGVSGVGAITVGANPAADLSGTIDGVGIVQIWLATYPNGSGEGYNYLNYTITKPLAIPPNPVAPVINGPGTSQTTYVGGTARFAVNATIGTPTLSYFWKYNGASLTDGATGNGSTIYGSATSQLIISNVAAGDAGNYSAIVSNATGTDTTDNYAINSLTVNPLDSSIIYAETFPFIGPFQTADPLATVGWRSVVPTTGITNRLDNRNEAYAYETAARTMGFFTSTNLDTNGVSGLPFPAGGITPANYPFVSFQATYAAVQNAANAGVFFAVQMANGAWFVSTSANQPGATPANFTTYGLQFSPVASGWNQLTVPASFTGNVTVGATATSDLTNKITGVGLVFVFTGAALFDINNVSITTNSTPPIAPSFPSLPNVPYPQTVYSGGGASFSFTEAGTLPFTNHWDFNQDNIFLTDGVQPSGSIISGSGTTRLTIQNASSADAGVYRGVVFNPATTNSVPPSTTDTGTFGATPLTVQVQPVGLIYTESFPQYSAVTGNQSLTNVGWTNQSTTANGAFILFHNGANTLGTYAAFAFGGVATNALYYASTASDNGFSGLPFIAFSPANYPAGTLQFTANFASGNAAYTNVSASFAVRVGTNWYAYATPVIPQGGVVPLNGSYTAYSQTPSFGAGQWNSLILSGTTSVAIGALNAQPLSAPITASGLLFQHFAPANGTINFNAFSIQAVGTTGQNLIGGLNAAPGTNGSAVLTWVGNPAVKVQSTLKLNPPNWQDEPNTLGNHTLTVSSTGSKFYRLAGPSAP